MDTALFHTLLDRLVAGDELLRASFGFERSTIAPPWHEEVLTLSGDGLALLTTVRSIADLSGERIGTFHGALAPDNVRYLASLVRQTGLASQPSSHIEGLDLRVTLTTVVGGEVLRVHVGAHPQALVPLRPLLQELDRIAAGTRQNAKCTLGLGLALPATRWRRGDAAQVELSLVNEGSEGAWVTHPGAIVGDGRGEQLTLHAAPDASPDPDVTTTIIPVTAPLTIARATGEPELLWLAGGATLRFVAHATPMFVSAGPHVVRAQYATYPAERTIAGRARIRGAVFSEERAVEVL